MSQDMLLECELNLFGSLQCPMASFVVVVMYFWIAQ